MRIELYDYDVFPKVFPAGREQKITVKPLGCHAKLTAGKAYRLVVSALEQGDVELYPDWALRETMSLTADADNCLRFSFVFPSEQEYLLTVIEDDEKETVLTRQSVYALAEDLCGRYPFRGDFHVHSCRSDGREAPEIVIANYRGWGYDFMILSDHRRYYPSLDMRAFYRDVAPSFCILPGEEVQLPLTDIHIINAGGRYSINALVDGNRNQAERGDDPSVRSLDGNCPPVLSFEEYEPRIRKLAENGPFGSEKADISYAACLWAYDRIREAGGMAIFCHPYWRRKWCYQVPEVFIDRMLKEHRFDAFEVLGGERYYEHNGFQTAKYHETLVEGEGYPIVGSTDTHGSTEHNLGGRICSTIVFSPENTPESLTASVKEKYSVAVDTISKEFRLVGSLRLQKYACFLMNWYYPLHDRLCAIEGEYLREFAVGEEQAKARLDLIRDDVTNLMKKYVAF